jgi:nucleoside 2-deoxyribosyltransferase
MKYLAGPDVFARCRAAASARACAAAGIWPVPLEQEAATPAAIYAGNLRLITEADCVLANLNPFRGAEPDSGTCVEIGYALALGKRVVGYADDLRPLRDRLQADSGDLGCRDAAGWTVEDFGLPLNLMLAVPLRLAQGGLEAALGLLAERAV